MALNVNCRLAKLAGGQIYLRNNLNVSFKRCINLTYPRHKSSSEYPLKSSKELLNNKYNQIKHFTEARTLPANINVEAIFANNELDLNDIEVYGFDYDYTLAVYKDSLIHLIYHLARNLLITEYKYPKEILSPEFDFQLDFASRGLHCDVHKGYLMKIDAFHNIQTDSVYRGWKKVAAKEVFDTYNGFHISSDALTGYYGSGPRMHQLMDLFSVPEMTLLANINEYFIRNNVDYCPENVFYDIRRVVSGLHKSGELHNVIIGDLSRYLNIDYNLKDFLQRLSNAGKKLFLITNSKFSFVDKGMRGMLGGDWTYLFDVIITDAHKPKFFTDSLKHFRKYDLDNNILTWGKVERFEKGSVYLGGNFFELTKLTGWAGHNVLYMGDHVYTDLLDATLKYGWRTGAVIPELEREVEVMNSEGYKKEIMWSFALDGLVNEMQVFDDAESMEVVDKWLVERNQVRNRTRNLFNKRFGSIFRTYHNATFFSSRFKRYADVYTGSVTNFQNYSLSHTFYPRRVSLPHELDLYYPSIS